MGRSAAVGEDSIGPGGAIGTTQLTCAHHWHLPGTSLSQVCVWRTVSLSIGFFPIPGMM